MNLDITFKNLRPRKELRERADFLYAKLERFLDPAAEGTLMVSVEHGEAILELVVTTYGETHTAIEDDSELRTALDKVFHTMENRLRRHKERRTDRRHTGAPTEDGFVPVDS